MKLELEELQSKLQGVENEKKHWEAKYDQVSRLNKVFKRHVNQLSSIDLCLKGMSIDYHQSICVFIRI